MPTTLQHLMHGRAGRLLKRIPRAIWRRIRTVSVLASARYRCSQCGGFKAYIDTRDSMVGRDIATGRYEPHVAAAMRETIRSGDTVVDIGANMGYFSLLAASLVGSEGRVIAFEPGAENVALLTLSARENGYENLDIHQLAVAEREQQFKYYPNPDNSLAHVVDASREDKPHGFRLVSAVSLDEFLAELPRLDVVKIDIDGNEPRAFQGMRRLLERHRPVLLFEYAPVEISRISRIAPESLIEEIFGHGYDLVVLNRDGSRVPVDDVQAVCDAHERSGITHIDLAAYPKRGALRGA